MASHRGTLRSGSQRIIQGVTKGSSATAENNAKCSIISLNYRKEISQVVKQARLCLSTTKNRSNRSENITTIDSMANWLVPKSCAWQASEHIWCKGMTIRQVIEQKSNRLSNGDSENLITVWNVALQRPPNAFNNAYHLCRRCCSGI